jgi:hypothetical protein
MGDRVLRSALKRWLRPRRPERNIKERPRATEERYVLGSCSSRTRWIARTSTRLKPSAVGVFVMEDYGNVGLQHWTRVNDSLILSPDPAMTLT